MALVLWVAGSCLVAVPAAHATVPHLIRYQGTLADTQQVPLEGTYTLTFRLYDATTGGTNVWEETQTNVPLTKGQFSVLLGQVTPLELAFDKDLWLSVEVNHDGEMSPRQQLSSVPYAYRAAVAETAQVALTAQNMKTTAIEDDGFRFVPSGVIVMVAGSSCPSGYTRFAALDNKFLVASSAYNPAAGGSNTHTHSAPAHTHSFSGSTGADGSGNYRAWNAGPGTSSYNGDASRGWHTHGFSGTTSAGGDGATGTADSRPEFSTVLLCQKQ